MIRQLTELQRVVIGATVWLALAGVGCAAQEPSLKKKVRALETEVARLQAERTNLAARNSALDDEAVVLKKKLERCRKKESPKALQVVRLSPGQEELRAEPSRHVPQHPPSATISTESRRPQLTLIGNRAARPAAPRPALDRKLSTGDFSSFGADNLGVMGKSGSSAQGPAMDRFHAAYQAYMANRFDEALSGFAQFIADEPNHGYADNAIFWRGMCFLAQKRFPKAIGEFGRLLKRYPRSEKAPSAMYRTGFAYDQLHDFDKAKECYFQLVDRFPGSDAARKASQRVNALKQRARPMAGLVPVAVKR